MKSYNLFLVAILAWFVPAFASAQDSLRDSLEDRARSVEVDGHSFYRMRAETNEPYNDLLVLAAPGTTPEQIDALNIGYVNYACRSDGRRRVPPTRNGRFVDGGVESTIDFATFASTQCAEGEARRELVVGSPYLIPREIIRSPSERLSEITDRITVAPASEVRTVVDETRDQAQTLIAQGMPPSAVADYTSAVSAAMHRLPATRTTVVPHVPPVPPVVDPVLTARIAELETELVVAQRDVAQAQGMNWFLIFVCVMLTVVLVWALVTRKRGLINMSESQANLLRKQLNEAWQLKLDDIERQLDTAKSAYKAVHKIYEDVTKETVTLAKFPEALKTYLVKAMGVAKTSLAIVPFPPPAPPTKNPFEATENNYREIFRDVMDGALEKESGLDRLLLRLGRMVDAGAKEALAFLFTSTHQHLQLREVWHGAVGDHLTFDGGNIVQLVAGTHPGRERAVSDAVEARDRAHAAELNQFGQNFDNERDDLNARIRERTEAHSAELSKNNSFLGQIETLVRDPLHKLLRGDFGSLLTFQVERRSRVIDAEKVQARFSRVRTFEKPKRKKVEPGEPREMSINEIRTSELTSFMSLIHEASNQVLDAVDVMLGRKPVLGDLTPAPGSHAIPPAGALPVIEQPTGLGTEPLTDQEEGETTERPDPVAEAIAVAAEFRDRDKDADDGESELEGTGTSISIQPTGTQPFARALGEEPRVKPEGGNGSNGHGRAGEEVTKVVPLDDMGRPRRDTVRGIAAAPRSEPPPEREPAE